MLDTFKFPGGGYDVSICRKQDILDCIDDNIIDKEIALTLVEQCERDAADFINQGKWASIPFIGNIRVPPHKVKGFDEEQKAILEDAKENLDRDQYLLFRKNLQIDNYKQACNDRHFNYIVSKAVTKNKKLFTKLCNIKGENFAKVYLFTIYNLDEVDSEEFIEAMQEYYGKQQTSN